MSNSTSDRSRHSTNTSGLIFPTPTKELGFLSPRRRPLNPVYTSHNLQESSSTPFSDREFVSIDKETYKRRIHKHAENNRKDAYLCERRVIVKRSRKVDLVVLPPKQIRMDDWCPQKQVSEMYRRTDRHIFSTSHISSSCASEGKEVVSVKPWPRQCPPEEEPNGTFTASVVDLVEHIENGDVPKELMASFTFGRVPISPQTLSKCNSIDSTKLPWDDWKEKGQREISLAELQQALLSEEKLNAVGVIETDDHILIKFEPVDPLKESPPTENDASKHPLSLIGKLMKWVTRS